MATLMGKWLLFLRTQRSSTLPRPQRLLRRLASAVRAASKLKPDSATFLSRKYELLNHQIPSANLTSPDTAAQTGILTATIPTSTDTRALSPTATAAAAAVLMAAEIKCHN
jgi:hypothetical protein